MATVFKRGGKGNWVAQWFNHDKTKRLERSTRTKDKRLAERLANEWEDRETMRREGLIDVRAEALAVQTAVSLRKHLTDFSIYLESKGTSAQTVDTAESRIASLLDTGKLESTTDLSPSKVLAALRQLRTPGVLTPKGLSNKTANHYITAIKGFSKWLHREKRAAEDELAGLHGLNDHVDRRRVRRDATPEEFSRILDAAQASESVTVPRQYRAPDGSLRVGTVRMTYPERAWAYRVAAGTGFRVSEVASLTRESFALDAEPPTVTVQAAYSKRKRMDVQPIRRDLAEALRGFLSTKPTGERVFALPEKKAALLLRADMEAARTKWIAEAPPAQERAERERSDFLRHTDSQGKIVDFHGLRHTYISNVVQAGASVKVAQELARHSTPTLTIGLYAHTRREDLAAALDHMPTMAFDLRVPGAGAGAQTNPDPQHWPQHLVREAVPESNTRCDEVRRPPNNKAPSRPLQSRGLSEPVRTDATCFENAEGRTRTADLRVMNPAL